MFGFGKKKELAAPACACSGAVPTYETEGTACGCCGDGKPAVERVRVLGSGCKSCRALFENTQAALKNRGLSVEAEYVTDLKEIAAAGVMSTPALVVNGQVVSMGRVLSEADVEALLRKLGY